MPKYTSPPLSSFPHEIVKFKCDRCGREGQSRKATLIERYGADMPLPSVLTAVAQCPRMGKFQGCGVVYANLVS